MVYLIEEVPSTESGLPSCQRTHSVERKVNLKVPRSQVFFFGEFESESETHKCTRDFKQTLTSTRVLLGRIHIVPSLPLSKSSSQLQMLLKLYDLTPIKYATDLGAYAAKSSV